MTIFYHGSNMANIDTFLTALKKVCKKKGISFIPRWASVKDEKFPAYTKFSLEVSELTGSEITQRFFIQKVENLSDALYCIKDHAKEVIKESMIEEMIEIMLKYYMYGDVVQ